MRRATIRISLDAWQGALCLPGFPVGFKIVDVDSTADHRLLEIDVEADCLPELSGIGLYPELEWRIKTEGKSILGSFWLDGKKVADCRHVSVE